MSDNKNDVIESKAITTIEQFFQERETRITSYLSKNDKFPLFDGEIIVYKSSNINNDNISDTISTQVKGRTRKDSHFKATKRFPVDKNFLRIIHGKLGGIFFLVMIDSNDFKNVQSYYKFLNFDDTLELLEKIKNRATISIFLEKLTPLIDFSIECDLFITKKNILIEKIKSKSPNILEKRIPKALSEGKKDTWYKTIYFNGQKYFDKHPLSLIYHDIKQNHHSILLIGEPRLGKSFEMEALNAKLKEDKYFSIFFDLSQYRGTDLETELGLTDVNLPYNILLDAYDEISPYHLKSFNSEIERISKKYDNSTFVISSRENYKNNIPVLDCKNGFNAEVYLVVSSFQDVIKANDEDAEKILTIESETLRELFMIPIYRPIITEITDTESIYDTLIYYALRQNRNKIATRHGQNALQPDDILISRFTEIALSIYNNKAVFISKEENNLLFEMDFLKSIDGINYTFSNKTYYDYFIASKYLKSSLDEILEFFFVRNKLKVTTIDIFVILFDLIKFNNKIIYNELFKKLESFSIESLLLSDFSTIPDDTRYSYFIQILENRNRNRNYIYYTRVNPEYGPLKSIGNMAKRMQELLPNSKKIAAFNVLTSKINEYLRTPDKEKIVEFANSIILLNQYSANIWDAKQLNALEGMTIQIIRFFFFNENSKIIKNLLSYRIIFLWYRDYGWTDNWNEEKWVSFLEKISNERKPLDSEITSNSEFNLKIILFCYFSNNDILKNMVKSLLFYILKEVKPVSSGTMGIMPKEITDNDTMPILQIDHDLYIFYNLLTNMDIHLNIILELLIYTARNDIKDNFYGIHNPVKILEDKLYKNLNQLTKDQYSFFSDYFLNKEALLDMHKFFEMTKDECYDQLKIFIIKKAILNYSKISRWIIESMFAKLLDLHDYKLAEKQFYELKSVFSSEENKGIYAGIIYEIYNNTHHILYNHENIKNDYITIFAERIEIERKHNELKVNIKKDIDKMLSNDLQLMIDNSSLLNEVSLIIDYLNNPNNLNEMNTFIGKIRSLETAHILNNLDYFYGQKYEPPPIFSKTALFFVEKIVGVNYTGKSLNKIKFLDILKKQQESPYYIYFYWLYIDQYKGESVNEVIININEKQELKQNILKSMEIDVPERFVKQTIDKFEGNNSVFWVAPFILFTKYFKNNVIPEKIDKSNAIKLISCINPYGVEMTTSLNINLQWFKDIFCRLISDYEITKYGLECIGTLKNSMSRFQILNYLLEFYNKKENSGLEAGILEYIIKRTREMFSDKGNNDYSAEYSFISSFWFRCEDNFVNEIFPTFTIEAILSTTEQKPNDVNYQYRKTVIEYCINKSTESQKEKIIHDIKTEPLYTHKHNDYVINQFLASLGDEKSIIYIIDGYLNGDSLKPHDIFNMYNFGCLHKSDILLNKYIDLLFYSTNYPDDQYYIRRDNLIYLARNGIQQHITVDNFKEFEDRMYSYMTELQIKNKFTEFYEEFLLQMEQYVFST